MKSTLDDILPSIAKQLAYDPESGLFTRLATKDRPKWWNSRYAGKPCGWGADSSGYLKMNILLDGRRYTLQAHRVAWFMVNGSAPDGDIDHINGDSSDNRIANLRPVSVSTNHRNRRMRSDNTSGICGVFKCKRSGKWEARVGMDGKQFYLGSFSDARDAERVVIEFRSANGFTERHGSNNARPAKD